MRYFKSGGSGSGGGGTSTLTNTHLFVGNGSNVATDVAASGDVTLANTGAFTVATVGTVSAANVASGANAANAATNTNTASTIVKRDANNGYVALSTPTAAITVVSSSPFNVGTTEALLFVDTSGARTINLPNPNTFRLLRIKDKTGNCATNNITLARFASEKIEGIAASRTLQSDWGSWILQSDGTDWFLI